MDIQTNQTQSKLLPRQPDMQAETRAAGGQLDRFNSSAPTQNNSFNQMIQQLLLQLVKLLLAQLKNPKPTPIDPQPVYGVIIPPDDHIIQPVYGVIISPEDPIVQPVYGAVIDPDLQPVYGAPQNLS